MIVTFSSAGIIFDSIMLVLYLEIYASRIPLLLVDLVALLVRLSVISDNACLLIRQFHENLNFFMLLIDTCGENLRRINKLFSFFTRNVHDILFNLALKGLLKKLELVHNSVLVYSVNLALFLQIDIG